VDLLSADREKILSDFSLRVSPSRENIFGYFVMQFTILSKGYFKTTD